jgi:hypothetical protein
MDEAAQVPMSASRDDERFRRIRDIVSTADAGHGRRDLCGAGVDVLGVSGVSLMLRVDDRPTPVCASNALAAHLGDLQHTLGEGPGVDAEETGRPVAEPDLARPRLVRWIAFGPAALEAGAGALFSFPLRLGAVRLGALTLYEPSAGSLSDGQHADALVMAGVMFNAILAMQTGAPAGILGRDLEPLADYGAEVHQASGMVSVQLEVSVGEALVRLRAHAYAAERPLTEVAAGVVRRGMRIDG